MDPGKIRHRIVLENLSKETMMLFKQACTAASDAKGATCTDDELVRALAAAMLDPASWKLAEQAAAPARDDDLPGVQQSAPRGRRDGDRRVRRTRSQAVRCDSPAI
ncbi:MAG: hypothetical protein IPQ07_44185 [Myxococcales bacterium]|nr:hypothetical protein [Myxococcales bacterium]